MHAAGGFGLAWAIASRSVLASVLGLGLLAAGPADGYAAPALGHTTQQAGRYGEQLLPTNRVALWRGPGRAVHLTIPFAATCDGGDGQGLIAPLLDRVLITAGTRHGDITGPGSASPGLSGAYSFAPGPAQSARVSVTLRGRVAGGVAAGSLDVSAVLTTHQGTSLLPECSAHLRWRSKIFSRAQQLATPRRARPRPLFHGVILFRLEGDPVTPGASLQQLVPPHTEQYALSPSSSNGAAPLTLPPPTAADSQPATNDKGRPIAFVRTVDGVDQVEAFAPMTSLNRPFSPLLESKTSAFADGARDPAVSPTGVIVFSAGRSPDCSLWATDLDIWQPRQVTDHGGRPGCDSHPAWSPDGRLAFRRTFVDAAGDPEAVQHLVMDSLEATPQRLDFGTQEPEAFSWAPGRDLTFITRDPATGVATLATMRADGSNRRTVFSSPKLVGRPVWSPPADQILFETTDAGAGTDLMRIALADRHVYAVTNTPGVAESDAVWTSPLSSVGGIEGGPGIHVKSQSARPHARKRRPKTS